MSELLCDFCSEPLPVPVRTYYVDGILSGQLYDGREFIDADGQWAACGACVELIDARRIDELLERAVDGAFRNAETRDIAFTLGRDNVRERCAQIWEVIFPELFEKRT